MVHKTFKMAILQVLMDRGVELPDDISSEVLEAICEVLRANGLVLPVEFEPVLRDASKASIA